MSVVSVAFSVLACGDPSTEATTTETSFGLTSATASATASTGASTGDTSSGGSTSESSGGSTSGGSTTQSSTGSTSEGTTSSGSASTGDTSTSGDTTGGPVDYPPMDFNLIFRQSVMACSGCGIWFDWQGEDANKPRLEVTWSLDGQQETSVFRHGLDGAENAFGFFIVNPPPASPEEHFHSILVKQSLARTGLFRADIREIPPDAQIDDATLFLHIHSHEGLANSDTSSVLEVHECERDWNWNEATWNQAADGVPWDQPGGDFGELIREIRAKEDLHGAGFNKGNPDAHFDFTDYVKKLQAERG
ncbi:MAG: DNRLRE domain-containing protein [Myxococcales bacterium]|nr:DNRLRE domain-containing protein [Myxococcales bacterium]